MALSKFAAAFILLSSAYPLMSQDQGLCEAHDWFASSQSKQVPRSSLCDGVLAAGLGKVQAATKLLQDVIHHAPNSEEAYRAHEVLLSLDFRSGHFHKALAEADAMLFIKPSAADISGLRPLLIALSQHPDLSIQRSPSLLPYTPTQDPNPHLPVTVNGTKGLFYMDTGANISAMSDAEATALGLTIQSVSSKMGDISGTAMSLQTAEVKDLWIGKNHLRNVSFIVFPATQPPFNDIPLNQQAILGIQVLLALETIHLGQDNSIEVAGPSPLDRPGAQLAFYQSQPLVQMSFHQSTLIYSLDTGAIHTTLNPTFAARFSDVLAQGEKKEHTLTGQGGSTKQESVELKDISFSLADAVVSLSSIPVLLQTTTAMSGWTGGNLGYDLIQQTAPFTLDFKRMKLFSKVP